ncbi:DUF488 domain-containing protein [Phytoactinopolyspora halotolerans]|uniref:DUF488 domain-containing protein n=1 Tax=Phytoactinopolyspora halotolerans TaxID=1981512 RepID=A0A6L9SCY3_9ACTN|nr:DUF488 domain-containing protein [Phytoactinopolyspora halotolerans]NEE02401.1 DUF488 domain-containing protein [Phytoactinopolyspora halotolerans]
MDGSDTAPAPLYTLGHGARTIEAFVAVLTEPGIDVLVDVRRFPGSRRHPQFGRDALAAELTGHGIRYEWHGDELGGRRGRRPDTRHTALVNASFGGYADHMDTPGFRTAVAELITRTGEGEQLAVLCAETLWWRCHRSFIADAVACHGRDVVHLLDVGRRESHRARPTLRCSDDDGWPVYDVPDTLPLDEA